MKNIILVLKEGSKLLADYFNDILWAQRLLCIVIFFIIQRHFHEYHRENSFMEMSFTMGHISWICYSHQYEKVLDFF